MKKALIFLSLISFVSCNNKNGIELTANDTPDNTAVYLLNVDNEAGTITKIDSTTIKNGKAFLAYPFYDIEKTYLQIGKEEEGRNIPFFSDPGIIKIDYNYNKPIESKVLGTKNNEIFQEFNSKMAPILEKMQHFLAKNSEELINLDKSDKVEDRKKFQKLSQEYRGYIKEYHQILDPFIKAHKNDYVGLDAFYIKVLSQESEIKDLKEEFDTFEEALRNSKMGKKISYHFIKLDEVTNNALNIGDKVPNFTIPSTDGKEVELYEFIAKNKLTLIDFWASWCGPCRMENPNLVLAYQNFQDKGFEILGVSMDSNRDKWLAAIKEDGLKWVQLSNLIGTNDPITKEYAIDGIPASFLVNADGIIVALDLRENELIDILEKEFE